MKKFTVALVALFIVSAAHLSFAQAPVTTNTEVAPVADTKAPVKAKKHKGKKAHKAVKKDAATTTPKG